MIICGLLAAELVPRFKPNLGTNPQPILQPVTGKLVQKWSMRYLVKGLA